MTTAQINAWLSRLSDHYRVCKVLLSSADVGSLRRETGLAFCQGEGIRYPYNGVWVPMSPCAAVKAGHPAFVLEPLP